ncbi:hypothetical protein J6590_051973 [Homalodisca vitripennis]|nr:hypothetical protein J6590_051973 [Homalodisca vitripennis]
MFRLQYPEGGVDNSVDDSEFNTEAEAYNCGKKTQGGEILFDQTLVSLSLQISDKEVEDDVNRQGIHVPVDEDFELAHGIAVGEDDVIPDRPRPRPRQGLLQILE